MSMKSYDTVDAYWQDIHNFPLLTEEEERQLANKIQQGDEQAIERLVTGNLRFVVSVARQYVDRGLNMDDLISEGNIALMVAARKWQPAADERFISYAVWGVRQAMEKALERQTAMITLPKNAEKEKTNIRQFSTDAPLHPGQSHNFGDILKAGKPDASDEAEGNEISFSLMQALHVLNDRERRIVTACYGIGGTEQQTMAEIGNDMGLRRERVRQIRKTAERKMRRIINLYKR